MTQKGLTRWQSCLAGRLTFSAKRQAALHRSSRHGSAGAAFLALALATPTVARGEIGPTSSAKLSISVSVAPKYGLRTTGVRAQAYSMARPERFCVATNGSRTALPILLVRSRLSRESVEELRWCAPNSPVAAVQGDERGTDGAASTLLIIRPE